MIKYLLEKEFKQLLRNPMLPRMLLVFPCIILLVLPWAANFEIKNMNLSIVDNDRSPYSTRLVQKVGASEYFHLIDVSNNYQEAMQCIEKGDADLILEIPPHFERDLLKTGVAKVLVSANTVNGTKGTLGSSYLSNIVNAYATEIRISHSGSISPSPVIKIDTQGRFNPYLDYKVFMVPALMAQLLMMLCGFLPALNIVSEKEFGTIEQINDSCKQVHFHSGQADSLLGNRHADPHNQYHSGMVSLWSGSGRSFMAALFLRIAVHYRHFGYGTGSFQLFPNHAAGHVCHVFLCDYHHADERIIHPHQQYARVGSSHHHSQSLEIFYTSDTYGLFERKRIR